MTCYASDLEGRKDESVPPDLWFVMQLSLCSTTTRPVLWSPGATATEPARHNS